MDQKKPAYHGPADHRDEQQDAISGPWFPVLDVGDDPEFEQMEEDTDYVYLQNGWAQPTPGSGPNGGDLEDFSFRRGLSQLDFTGHLDGNGAASDTVALTIPEAYRLAKDKFFHTVIYDGTTPQGALVYIDSVTGDVTITFPI